MKKFAAIIIGAAALCTSIYTASAAQAYVNDFSNDSFVWTRSYTGNDNYIIADNSSEGYEDNSAKKIVYDHRADTWSTYVSMKFPSDWDMSGFGGGAYIHFLAKSDNETASFSAMTLELTDTSGKTIVKKNFTAEDSSYEHIIIPVTENLSELASIKITDNMKGTAGTLTIDDFAISADRPERRIKRTVSQTADFEISQTTLTTASTFAGFKNTAGDYSDYIRAKSVSGKSGNGLELSYRAATWYSGEVFLNAPQVWDTNKDINAVEFDYKGSGRIKIKLMCEKVIAGSRYETSIALTDDSEWHHVILPLSDFKKSGVAVTKEDIIGMAFTSAENGNLNNNAAETKAMSAEQLTAKARMGTVVLDNISLTNNLGMKVSAKLYQDGRELNKLSEAVNGTVTARADFSNCSANQPVTAVLAVYYTNGALCKISVSSDKITNEGTLKCETEISDAAGKRAKMFFLNSLQQMLPISDSADF